MTRIFLLLAIFVLPVSVFAELVDISFGPVRFGEPRIPIDLKHFEVRIKKHSPIKIRTGLLKNSVQWIRTQNNLLIPRARLGLMLKIDSPNIHFLYQGQAFIPEKRKGFYYSELFVHLFTSVPIKVFNDGELVAEISIETNIPQDITNTKQIDYSCSKFGLEIEGLENEYISVGCHLERKGEWGSETPRLEVTWSTTNYTLMDGTNPPFITVINGNYPMEVEVKNHQGVRKKIKLKTKLPNRLHRVLTAYGFGPYMFESNKGDLKNENSLAPALFLYGKIELTESSSFRFFDALIFKDGIFNNFGLYFAYDLARLFDGKIQVIPLLGTQTLSFKFDSSDTMFTQIIYPQGFELVFKHFLGIENYTVVYGMFLSTESEIDYTNAWVRWGKGYFWELNYISWAYGDRKASMYGLSVGLPLVSFF